MKQSGHLNPSEETGTGFPVTSKYGRTPLNKHGGIGRQQQQVKSVVKYLVLFIFTHQSCTQIDKMLVASWSRILTVVAYSSMLHRTKSSAYIAHFIGDGNFMIRSLMNTKKRVGDMIPPCGTPCLRSICLLFVLSMTTIDRRLCIYDLIH